MLGLSQTVGLQLEGSIAANSATTVDISSLVEANVESQYADIINPFSSTGPNNNPNYLKLDLAAPGTNILSAYSPDEFSFGPFPFGDDELPEAVNNDPIFATLTGTSMASPHVAGAAALLKQQHPQWSVAQIKSALVNTAESNVLLGSEIAGPFEKGAGRLDLERAMAPTLSFSQVSFSDPACIASCEFEFTVTNLTLDNQEWTLTTDFNNSLVHAMVSPASFSLSAEASQVINITVDVSNADPAHPLYNQWEFGQLVATSTNGLQLSMPIVANANDSSDQGSLLVFHDASDLQSGSSVPFTVRTRNLGELDEVNLNVQVSDNAKLLVNSEAVELRNGETQTLSANDNSIQWQGVLAQGTMLLKDNSLWDGYLLSEQEVTPIACDEGCGFLNAVVEFDFQFNGNHYQTLTLSDNGFVVPGQQSFGFISALFNQPFPQQDQLNNVIAPFWTEFDLLDENMPFDTGGGYLRAAVRVVDDVNYLIVEWDKVVPFSLPEEDEGELPTEPFPEDPIPEDPIPEDPAPEDPLPEDPLPGDPLPEDPAPDLPDSPPPGDDPLDSEAESFTFQLIIQENTDNIWFKYYNIPYLPEALSIGAENEDGRVGINYHFDGTGNDVFISLSESSKTMRLTTLPEGRSIITFDVELHGEQDYAQPDSYNLMEDTETGLPVLDNDRDYSFATITSDIGTDSIFSAVSSARIPATGGLDSNSLTIMAQPSHGIATVENGAILYQPSADYFGADQFSYQVTDASGDHISSTNVALEISPVNDAPIIGEINAGADFVVSENQMLSFTVPASDVDSETLSLSASVTSSGVMPTFTIDGMQVNMNGLSVSQDTSIQLQLVVSDGIDQSAPVTVTISIEDEDSGGSITWLLALLLSCCGRRFTRSRH